MGSYLRLGGNILRGATTFEAERAIIEAVLGPMMTQTAARALSANHEKYELGWDDWEPYQWTTFGSIEEISNRGADYDRAAIYFAMYARTGNTDYRTRGLEFAADFRDYQITNNGGTYAAFIAQTSWAANVPFHGSMKGLTISYLLTGNEQDRVVIGRMADWASGPTFLTEVSDTDHIYADTRGAVRYIENQLWAYYIDAPTIKVDVAHDDSWGGTGGRGAYMIPQFVNAYLSIRGQAETGRVSHPGTYRWNVNDYYAKNFMDGLMNSLFIDLDRHRSRYGVDILPDVSTADFVDAVKDNVDFHFANTWEPFAGANTDQAFRYLEAPSLTEGDEISPDLNMMFMNGLAWVYHKTGTADYKTKALAVLDGAQNSYYNGQSSTRNGHTTPTSIYLFKQFSEMYIRSHWSYYLENVSL